MFKLSEIKELIKLIDQTSVHEFEIENEGTRLLIRKPGKPEAVVYQAAPPVSTYNVETSALQVQAQATGAVAASASPA